MTHLHSYVPLAKPARRAHTDTIYRDTPLNLPTRPARFHAHPLVALDERVSTGIQIGLAALLLPAVAYSFAQMWSLVSSGSLERAVQAFFPDAAD